MALVPNRNAAMMRRVAAGSLVADVVVALIVGAIIGSIVGWIIFLVGLVLTGLFYFNYRQTVRTRGGV